MIDNTSKLPASIYNYNNTKPLAVRQWRREGFCKNIYLFWSSHRTSFIDSQSSALEVFSIEQINSRLGLLISRHFDKAETFRLIVPRRISPDLKVNDSAGFLKGATKLIFCSRPRNTADKQSLVHLTYLSSLLLLLM